MDTLVLFTSDMSTSESESESELGFKICLGGAGFGIWFWGAGRMGAGMGAETGTVLALRLEIPTACWALIAFCAVCLAFAEVLVLHVSLSLFWGKKRGGSGLVRFGFQVRERGGQIMRCSKKSGNLL